MWYYQSNVFTEEQIGDYFGFVYIIENNQNGRKYIGKKFFSKAGYRQVKGKRKKIRKNSDWEDYFGSSEYLLEDVKTLGVDNFKRTILHLCRTKSECSYWETYEIFSQGALLKEEYYNSWVSCKIHKANLKTLLNKETNGQETE